LWVPHSGAQKTPGKFPSFSGGSYCGVGKRFLLKRIPSPLKIGFLTPKNRGIFLRKGNLSKRYLNRELEVKFHNSL